MNEIQALFVNSVLTQSAAPSILVSFKRRPDDLTPFSAGMLDLLKTDPAVNYIIDATTGEILFAADL